MSSRPFSLILIGLFLLLSTGQVEAQSRHTFTQLKRTRLPYISDKYRAFSPGPDPSSLYLPVSGEPLEERLERIRQRLVNLPAFTRADWALTIQSGDTVVQWNMEESRTVFPLVDFGGIRGNNYYQLGFNDIHFRGRGQHLTAFYRNNDGEHNYYLSLTNAAYRGSRWGYRFEVQRYAAVEPVYFSTATVNYRYRNQSYGVGGTYTFPRNRRLGVGVSTFGERYRKLAGEPADSPGPASVNQQKFLLKAEYAIDRLDRHGERTAGHHHHSFAQAVHTPVDNSHFLIAWHDFRYYRLVGQYGNLAGRLRAGLSTNRDTPFAPFVLDSQVNIRGSGNRIDRGTAQFILNLEYRHRIWQDRRDRLAVQLVGFSDFGTWRNPGGRLSDLLEEAQMRHFVGGGFRLIWLKAYDAVVRFDYGVDIHNAAKERGVVLGFGQYF